MNKREIKFRAWATDTKEMIPWEEFMAPEWFEDDEVIVMQCTGILDAKGNDVYEGDVVKNIIGDVGTVYFDESHAAFMFQYNHSGEPFFMDAADKDFEVIGNIYQHKRLLKKASVKP
jgi:uncharacterized phage protein (TIGR01671 family)